MIAFHMLTIACTAWVYWEMFAEEGVKVQRAKRKRRAPTVYDPINRRGR